MKTGRRFRYSESPTERLLEEAQNLRDAAMILPHGPLRDAALRKARQTEAAAHMDGWLNSPRIDAKALEGIDAHAA
ncbi:hypothetical protein [Bradyrhizobium sp. JYMT SZCCT0428]|uniref:hypothetical protein n=1 Tax=Bradyrhizobium sp. JYMT SZCCT0428 TaxID=2807673 RepID=UPI001BA74D13|nr:hypothetical protein [Bradyrhizobium sp. JYMT SZCCT0428]MBR1152964.1 hypothetical protein [Bradyrhizobium sp. JYMT SZCCT0428]